MEITPIEQSQLDKLCEWLWSQPCHAASSDQVMQVLPELCHWISSNPALKKKRQGWIYYQVGYGWRVDKKWCKKFLKIGV